MLIIPAIDIIDGQCVRLTQGDFATKKVYGKNPVEIATTFEKQGADIIHIVDLDGAKNGQPINLDLILEIRKAINIPMQIGGGIRTLEAARQYLDAGIDRIIIGTKAIQDSDFLTELIEQFDANRIVVGIDAKNNKVSTEGWLKTSDMDYLEFAKKLKPLGVTEIIFTDINRDGMLSEPNYEPLKNLNELGFNVVASGGISDVPSIKKLTQLECFGAIIGKALYENRITIQKARAVITSNLAKRIIACMDIKNGRVVKGTHFANLKDAGDPVELGKLYSEKGIDELVFLDVMATVENRPTFYDLVKRIAKNINIPFTVGGGISDLETIRTLLSSGADKVSIGSAATNNPELVRKAAEQFGSQCIVISVDPRKTEKGWEVYIKGGREATGVDAIEFAKKMEACGAGELLINSLDRDGTKMGYDIKLLRAISDNVNLPIIASSGAGKKEDFLEAFIKGKADAALAASLFHYKELDIEQLKQYLIKNNIPIRS